MGQISVVVDGLGGGGGGAGQRGGCGQRSKKTKGQSMRKN